MLGVCKGCGGIAIASCAVCGSAICTNCKRAYGCTVCGGEKRV